MFNGITKRKKDGNPALDLQEVGCVKESVIFFFSPLSGDVRQDKCDRPTSIRLLILSIYMYIHIHELLDHVHLALLGEKKWISALSHGDWQRKIAVPEWQRTGRVLVLNHCIDAGNESRNSSSDSQKWLYPSLWALSGLLVLLLIHLVMMLKCLDSCLGEQKRNTDDMVIYYDSLALRLSELHGCAHRAAFWPDSKVHEHLIKAASFRDDGGVFVLRKRNLEERCYFWKKHSVLSKTSSYAESQGMGL